ncbi:MAG: extracellular solute-binding protein [Lachnospiraceae bacterium]|nr:extracellular solute-binding protein [Lachnospiraceae bacterium]
MKKKWLKRLVVVATTAIMGLSLLAGCGGNDTETPDGGAAENVETPDISEDTAETPDTPAVDGATVQFRYWADTPEFSQLMQDIITYFNETNTSGITVVGEEAPWDGGGFAENLFNSVMGGADIDVATWRLSSTPLFVNNDLLADLTPFLDTWDGVSDIDGNIWANMREAGGREDATFVMPWNLQILYVYYRPSIFEEAGIEVPTTYEEFLAAIEATTIDRDGDGTPDVYGFGLRGGPGGQEPWGSFVHGRGGSFEDMTSAESIAGMQDFIDVFQNGFAPPTAPSDGFSEIIDNFHSGLTAMTIHHTGSSGGMEEVFGDDVSAFPFPAGAGRWTSMADTSTVIFESSENKEAAFEWVSFLATGEGQRMWTEGTGNIPVSGTVQAGEFFQNNRFVQASIESQGFGGVIPILDTTPEWISTIFPNTIGQALLGQVTAEEAMETLQDALYR